MSFDQKSPYATEYASAREIDLGLQSYMRQIFNTMGMGLVVTGLTAFAVANVPALMNLIFGTPLSWVALLAPLAFLWLGFTPSRMARMPASKVRTTFYLFSALMGLSMAVLFHVFTGASIARVFFITAATFSAMALYGYTTKRDLSAMGSFLIMGLIGVFIAALVNLFLQSAMVQFVVSAIGVIVFTGLTAWDAQRLKESYAIGNGDEANSKLATMGALSLYLNFINLFQMLLHLIGDRR